MIKGFTGAIVGGIGSVPGAILGSFLLGLVENFGIWFLPSDTKMLLLSFCFLLFCFLDRREFWVLKIIKHDRRLLYTSFNFNRDLFNPSHILTTLIGL